MAVTQYIGSRYVPLLADPVEWSAEKEYEPLTIVTHEGNSYTSRQFVPKGIDIANEAYWALTGNYDAQVEQYRRETQRLTQKYDGKVGFYDTLQDFRTEEDLINGTICYVCGYNTPNDGGGGFYYVDALTDDNSSTIQIGTFYAHVMLDDNPISVKRFGASPTNDDSVNLRIINDIIGWSEFGEIYIPSDISYGYKRNITTINPLLSSIRCVIIDDSIDKTYPDAQGQQAMQRRLWFNTPDDGTHQHDGNGLRINATHHPYLYISSNTNDPNAQDKRASIFFGINNTPTWQITQSIYSADEKFGIVRYHNNVGIPVFAINRENGYINFGSRNTNFPFGVESAITQVIGNDGHVPYQNVMDTTLATKNIFLQRTINQDGYERVAWKGSTKRETHYVEGADIFITPSGRVYITHSESVPFAVSNVGNTQDLLQVKNNSNVFCRNGVSGFVYTTQNRPTNVDNGTMIFDSTLRKPVWKYGLVWYDASGQEV